MGKRFEQPEKYAWPVIAGSFILAWIEVMAVVLVMIKRDNVTLLGFWDGAVTVTMCVSGASAGLASLLFFLSPVISMMGYCLGRYPRSQDD